VAVGEREQANTVRDVLERHGAQNIRFFSRLAVTDLTPLSNPTPRSDASPFDGASR
jgi:hypothetical protein